MKVSLDCNISLSKKLRAMIGDNGSITLMANGLQEGKGFCKLILEADTQGIASVQAGEMPQELKGETSIMITPITLTKENPPNYASQEVGTIFSTTDEVPMNTGQRTAVDKLAAVTPPETAAVPHALVPKEEIHTPEPFKELNNNKCKEFVSNLSELLQEVEIAKSKVADIDLSSITDPRLRAVEMERKEHMEAIDKSAYIVNEKAGVLTLNDLDITLAMNSPYDLSNISARRIAGSSELKGLLKAGYIKFITPDQIDEYVKKAEAGHNTHGLEVFDNHDLAEANMATSPISDDPNAPSVLHTQPLIDSNSMEVTAADMDRPTEEEKMIMDLTGAIGKTDRRAGVRSSTHGG